MKNLFILAVFAAGLFFTSCERQPLPPIEADPEDYPEIAPSAENEVTFEVIDVEADEAAKLIASGEVAVLDVRTQQEWDAGHIDGAVHCSIADPDFEKKMAELDYSKPFVVH